MVSIGLVDDLRGVHEGNGTSSLAKQAIYSYSNSKSSKRTLILSGTPFESKNLNYLITLVKSEYEIIFLVRSRWIKQDKFTTSSLLSFFLSFDLVTCIARLYHFSLDSLWMPIHRIRPTGKASPRNLPE